MLGGPSACMGNCYVKRGEKEVVYEKMTNLYGWSMSQSLPIGDFREIKVLRSGVRTTLGTPDKDEHGFLKECDSEYPSSIHEKNKTFYNFT